eukprot:8455845-Pyramimonas_sp.AAC.1
MDPFTAGMLGSTAAPQPDLERASARDLRRVTDPPEATRARPFDCRGPLVLKLDPVQSRR